MFKVKNKKIVRKLSFNILKANKLRNIIAICAIMLTTILFATVFSMSASLIETLEHQTFRQSGSISHVSLNELSIEEADKIASHASVKSAGYRLFLGLATDSKLSRKNVEISYMDKLYAKNNFCTPDEGKLPSEEVIDGYPEVVLDTQLLEVLGIECKVGAIVPITYELGNGEKITQKFSLSGWVQYDALSGKNMIIVSKSYCQQVLSSYATIEGDRTGTWSLDVMFDSSNNIEEQTKELLYNLGFQIEDVAKDNYISASVNWAYSSNQLMNNIDGVTVIGISIILIIIMLTGYLIIYNIFRISVTNDIRLFGLIKVIGTTTRQIRKIIMMQAMVLALIGITVGILIGYFIGNIFTPLVVEAVGYGDAMISANPIIFVGTAVFSLVTVWISCLKPARIAGKVSPVEALRYNEQTVNVKKRIKKGSKGAKIHRMAFANVCRCKSKTGLVIASLVLSALLLNLTFAFTNGFDMDKYTKKFRTADFIVGSDNYFQNNGILSRNDMLSEEIISILESNPDVNKSGNIYGMADVVGVGAWFENEKIDKYFENKPEEVKESNCLVKGELSKYNISLYGMDKYPTEYLKVIEGDISKIYEGNYIIEVLDEDDYNNIIDSSDIHEVGEEITVVYGNDYIVYDIRTGEEVEGNISEEYIGIKEGETWEKKYTICAKVVVPSSISYRSYGCKPYIISGDNFVKDSKEDTKMLHIMDVDDDKVDEMETFLKNNIAKENSLYDYESNATYEKDFAGFKNMFIIIGASLAIIVGITGVLNFINATVTSVISRRREFAVMQSVGMTGKQLKCMLMYEGLYYTVTAIMLSLIVSVVVEPFLLNALGEVLWFFTGKLTLMPLLILMPVYLILGIIIPVILYKYISKSTIVERLRVVE